MNVPWAVLALLLFLRLVPACPAEGWVTSEYGRREDPITHRKKFHGGIDIANKPGTPVRAPWPGKVVRVARAQYAGRFVVVESGPFRFSFLHLKAFSVSKGDILKRGDLVGLMGSSGRATGPHVHLSMRLRGKPRDPSVVLWACPKLP